MNSRQFTLRFAPNSAFWREAPLFWPLVLLVAGIIGYEHFPLIRQHAETVLGITILLAAASLSLALIRRQTPTVRSLYLISIILFFFSLGTATCLLTDLRTRAASFTGRQDSLAMTLVTVATSPQVRPATVKCVVNVLGVVNGARFAPRQGKALLYVYQGEGLLLKEGDTLLVPSAWRAITNAGNPFERDKVASYRRQNLFLEQSVSAQGIWIVGRQNDANTSWLNQVHNWADRQLQCYVKDSTTLGLLQAMLLGDEGNFDEELRTAYADTGVIHIVSISGSHVGVLFGLITIAFSWLRGRRGIWVKYLLGLALVWLYVLVAGAPPSALRSALMFTVIAAAELGQQQRNLLNAVISAAFALLIASPAWLFSVGFQLSFAAVLSIMIFYKPLYRLWYWPKQNRLTKWLWVGVCVSVAAEVLTAPLVIYYFHNFPLLFVIANLVAAVMAGTCALVGGLSIIALCWIPPLARLLGWVVTFLVSLFNKAILALQTLSVPALQHLRLSLPELILCFVLTGCLTLVWFRRSAGALAGALGIATCLLVLLSIDAYTTAKQEHLIVYSNGRFPCVELIQGRYYQTLARNESRAVKNAHIGFGAWRKNADSGSLYFPFKGEKVLIISDTLANSYEQSLPVDLLVIARPLRQIQVGNFIQQLAPKEVVLATRPSDYHLRRWKDSCAAHGIRLFNVTTEGAYLR